MDNLADSEHRHCFKQLPILPVNSPIPIPIFNKLVADHLVQLQPLDRADRQRILINRTQTQVNHFTTNFCPFWRLNIARFAISINWKCFVLWFLSAGFSNGFQNFGVNPGFNRIFRAENEDIEEEEMELSKFRYASPYDIPAYKHAKPAYKPVYAPAPVPAYSYSAPVQCPQNLLVGCAPQVQYVPCSAPPSSAYPNNYWKHTKKKKTRAKFIV